MVIVCAPAIDVVAANNMNKNRFIESRVAAHPKSAKWKGKQQSAIGVNPYHQNTGAPGRVRGTILLNFRHSAWPSSMATFPQAGRMPSRCEKTTIRNRRKSFPQKCGRARKSSRNLLGGKDSRR